MESQRSYSFGGDDDGGRGSGGCVRGTLQAIVLSGLSFLWFGLTAKCSCFLSTYLSMANDKHSLGAKPEIRSQV